MLEGLKKNPLGRYISQGGRKRGGGGGVGEEGVFQYTSYMNMYCCEGYGF